MWCELLFSPLVPRLFLLVPSVFSVLLSCFPCRGLAAGLSAVFVLLLTIIFKHHAPPFVPVLLSRFLLLSVFELDACILTCPPCLAVFAFGRLLHALSMWLGVPHLSQILPYAIHHVPNRWCASKPHEVHLPMGGQQLMSGDGFPFVCWYAECWYRVFFCAWFVWSISLLWYVVFEVDPNCFSVSTSLCTLCGHWALPPHVVPTRGRHCLLLFAVGLSTAVNLFLAGERATTVYGCLCCFPGLREDLQVVQLLSHLVVDARHPMVYFHYSNGFGVPQWP